MLILVRQGTKYGPEYVDVLRKQVKETSGLETLVLGDQDADIKLKYGWGGWWSKIELFRPDLPRPFIYVDLDSFILNDISALLGETLICREWHPNIKGCGRVQSSLIAVGEYREDIWETFIERPAHWMQANGDQNYLQHFDWDFIQDKYPGMVGSYKFHNKEKPIHRVVTFHGKPKQCNAVGWAQDLWNSLTQPE